MGSKSKAPCFLLLLLLLVARAPAQARDADHGPIYKERIPVQLKSSTPLCSTCENFTSQAVTYLIEKETQDKIREFLHDACSRSFSLEHKIMEIKPEEFCKQYGLCRDCTLFSGVQSDSTCVFCHHLLDEIMSKLKDPDAEFEIIQILIKECNKIEGHVQQCKRLVLQYIPLILVNGEKFLEKNDVCALVQACPASQKTKVGSFLDEGLVSDV
ncbi:unnamed protein product [Urochloa decumbens]|uniref:Saposin B-type domain-containing protein n=1 Tax=Urochloa decumbens TaxID=240449 RepID=A0ABC8VV31_9POAL